MHVGGCDAVFLVAYHLGAPRCGSDSLGSLKLGVGGFNKTGFVQAAGYVEQAQTDVLAVGVDSGATIMEWPAKRKNPA